MTARFSNKRNRRGQALKKILLKNPHVLANAAARGSSTFSVVLAQYPLLRRRNLSTYFERYYRNV